MEIAPGLKSRTSEDRRDEFDCRTRRRRRFEDDEIPFFQNGDNGFGRRRHRAHVGQFIFLSIVFAEFIFVERRGHGDDERVGGFGFGRDGEIVRLERGFDDRPKARLVNVNAAVAKRFDDLRIDVHADDFDSVGGKRGCGRQTDVAEAEDAKFLNVQSNSMKLGLVIRD